MTSYPFIRARNYTPVAHRKIDLLVIHDMEAPEKGSTAEAVANYFAGPNAPRASAHYCIDNDSIVQCVRDHDVAWHAPGANHNGIGLEHAGYAHQSRTDWLDVYSISMLHRSAELAAEKCVKYGIPIRFVNAEGLKAGHRGITTHAEVSRAYRLSDHTDPGPNFPMARYLAMVQLAATRLRKPVPRIYTLAELRARKGKQAWIDWRMGWGDWKRLGKRNKLARPNVRRVIYPGWWRALAHQIKTGRVSS